MKEKIKLSKNADLAIRNRMAQHADGMKMKQGLYIGIFDPINLGHMDIIERASNLVDCLVIGVVKEAFKPTEIDVKVRIEFVKKAVEYLKNVKVVEYNGRLSETIAECNITMLIRGLRMMTDFENEINLVHTTYMMNYNVDTVFLCANERYANYSSKEVREVARNHGKIEQFLPKNIVNDVKSIYA